METLRYGLVGSGFNAQFHLRALESVRGRRSGGPDVADAAARARGVGPCARAGRRARLRERAGDGARGRRGRDPQRELVPGRGDGGDRGGRARRRDAARSHLREAARAQPGRGSARDGARRRDRRADRVLREPDPHEDAPAGAGAAAGLGGRDGTAHAGTRRGGARRPAQRVVLGPGRNRAAACSPTWAATASRSGATSSHRPDGRRGSSSRRPCRRTSACSSGGSRAGAPSCSNATASTTRGTPAEDFATGVVTYRNPETAAGDARAVHRVVDVRQAGLAAARRRDRPRLRARGQQPAVAARGVHRRRGRRVGRRRRAGAGEGDRVARGLLAIQPNEPDLYGYTDENVDALAAFRAGRSALLDFEDGLDVVRLTMAAYLSAEQGRVDRPEGRGHPGRARVVRARDPAGPGRGGATARVTSRSSWTTSQPTSSWSTKPWPAASPGWSWAAVRARSRARARS